MPAESPVAPIAVAFPPYRRWLQGLAFLLVAATFLLIVIGGSVTSYDAGMAVPDGFTTFGYWSLTAPLELWWYDLGTRLEHSHRLKGYVVGWLTIGVLVGVLLTQRRRRWVKVLAWLLLGYVIAQGVLGILRVDEVSLWLAGVHGVTGQIFLALTVVMAAALGRRWMAAERAATVRERGGTARLGDGDALLHGRGALRSVPWVLWVWLALLLMQLALGSSIRHGQASLAIPDWPLHYGQALPPMSQEKIDAAVAALSPEVRASQSAAMLNEPVVAWRVHLHFAHRVGAYVTLAFGVAFLAWAWRRWSSSAVRRAVLLVGGLLALQATLGVYTVWSGVHPTLATLHQTVGAALLGSSVWLGVRMKLEPALVLALVAARPTVGERGLGGGELREVLPA